MDHVVLMIEPVKIDGFVSGPVSGQAFDALEDPIDVDDLAGLLDGLLNPAHGMLDQEL